MVYSQNAKHAQLEGSYIYLIQQQKFSHQMTLKNEVETGITYHEAGGSDLKICQLCGDCQTTRGSSHHTQLLKIKGCPFHKLRMLTFSLAAQYVQRNALTLVFDFTTICMVHLPLQ
jgi:hypothetical protein